MPKVFISYAWEEDVKIWVKEFADRLKSDGVEIHVDQYDLTLGDRLPKFMEEQITTADYVLIICTPKYKRKADKRIGGVGYEDHIISAELMNFSNERKFIPVRRKGTLKNATPTFLVGKLGIDLSEANNQYETEYQILLSTILGKNHNSIAQVKSNFSVNKFVNPSDDNDPISILEIIKDQVTSPTMDGTRGCALYNIPFRLSRKPSSSWSEFFIQSWDNPPRCTTMHLPVIASIHGDKIILAGTTVEEVKDYHKTTLLLCVDEANKKEKHFREKQRRQVELEEQRKHQHFSNVTKIADDIQF